MLSDLRYAFRQLAKSPGFSAVAIILGEALRLTLFRIGLGLVIALGLTRLMAQLLFGVQAHDPLIYAGISILLCLVAAIACWIPARRATRVDPLVALRAE